MEVFKPKFVTRNTWSLIRSSSQTVNWHESIWFSYATPKYAFKAWLAMHNRLTTGDRMLVWNANIDASCTLCCQHIETRHHLFSSVATRRRSGRIFFDSCFSPALPTNGKTSWCYLQIDLKQH